MKISIDKEELAKILFKHFIREGFSPKKMKIILAQDYDTVIFDRVEMTVEDHLASRRD